MTAPSNEEIITAEDRQKLVKSAYEIRRPHNMPAWKAVGKAISDRRKELGLTQAEVARKAKMAKSYYIHLEQGYNNPLSCPVAKKKAIAKALKTSVEELFSCGL